MQIVFKNNTTLGKNLHFKDQIPKYITSGADHKFQWGLCSEFYFAESVRHLNLNLRID